MAEIKGYGRLGTDPELKMVGANKDIPVTEFRCYLSSLKKNKGGETVDAGDWFSVSVWRAFAEPAAKLLKKGDPVYLEGTLRTDRWTNDKGEERSGMSIDARMVFPHLPAIESLNFKPRKSNDAGIDEVDGGADAYSQDALAATN
ncbi:MAG TPA: single-stranded DNA-binding protein [Armatimonadetes bacterium]|nr:single-stranded DNA-binding protein [Armatimonadota bacterium]